MIRRFTDISDVPLPGGLQAQLRPLSEKRLFMDVSQYENRGFGSIIADDMGSLEKTLQVITLLLKAKEEGALSKRENALWWYLLAC